MIDARTFFNELRHAMVLRCESDQDSTGLIHIAENVVAQKIPQISVYPQYVGSLWAWLEDKPVKIIARFDLDAPCKKGGNREDAISGLSGEINRVFKKGAHGAEIFIPVNDMDAFADDLLPIRDDLFFNRDLTIGLDLNDIDTNDWGGVFDFLNKLRAGAVLFYLSDNKKAMDYFIGRIYALFEMIGDNYTGQLQFALGNDQNKIEQIWRLCEKMRPDLLNKLKFFLHV
ncbi:hypothetical protein LJC18_04190 [Lachnospiraceae bacterium OttesenSCG-928-E19]|nr:hypothetical protein [Lachnospiraceae bacterium OttesenSCG-928-E19]